MARYFFDVRDGETHVDENGTELVDMAGVKRVAAGRMSAVLQGRFGTAWFGHDWCIIVRREDGAIVLVVTLVATETGL